MTLAAPTTVNCTSCGAGLDVLGGGRVMVHICPYCGSELDAQDNYKVLAKFEGMTRPDSPFRIGMKGRIMAVDYTVIGTLEYTETYRGQRWTWVDHQLYSPTHGYAWLTVEDGHPVFTRRYRRPVWLSAHRVESANTPPSVRIDGITYRYYETSEAEITFAEGEFTWAPRLGDRSTTISALSDGAMLGFSQVGEEREVYRSVLLDRAEVEAGFGVTLPPAKGMHPMTPYAGGGNDRFMRMVALAALVACFLLGIGFDARTGQPVGEPVVVSATSLPATVPVTIPDVPGPVRLSLEGTHHVPPLPSSPNLQIFATLSASLSHPDGRPVSGAPANAHVSIGGHSSAQAPGVANRTELLFPSAMSGDYLLRLEMTRQGPPSLFAQSTGSATRNGGLDPTPFASGAVTIRTHAGISDGYWLYRLGWIFALVAIFTFVRRSLFERRRWQGSDWSEE